MGEIWIFSRTKDSCLALTAKKIHLVIPNVVEFQVIILFVKCIDWSLNSNHDASLYLLLRIC